MTLSTRWMRKKLSEIWSKPMRGNNFPRHREHPVAHAAPRRFDRPAVIAQKVQHRAPPLSGPEHAVTGDAGPRAVRGDEQGVDRLARDIVVDKHFGQAFG